MLAYLRMLRPLNCLMTALAVFIGGLIVAALPIFWNLNIYYAMLAAFLIAGAGNVINDYTDVEADRINAPQRPIPSGRVSPRSALAFSLILFIAGIVLAGFINYITFLIALINSLLLIGYSANLQNKILLGNVTISYLVGSGFLFGGAAVGNLILPLLLMLLAGLANLSREIVKDLEDIEGDKLGFLRKLTSKVKEKIADRFGLTKEGVELKYDKRKLIWLAALSLILAISISPLPYTMGILGLSYLMVLVPTDLTFLFAVYRLSKDNRKKGYHRISKTIKLGMLLGLIAFIAGALI